MGDDVDARVEGGGGEDCFVEVLERVGALHLEGAHRAGEDDGDVELAVELFVDPLPGFAEGVGAVEDDDPVARGVVGVRADDEADGVGDALAVGVAHVERVFLHELEGVELCVLEAEEAQHLLDDGGPVAEVPSTFVVRFFDGAAGGYKRDLTHRRKVTRGV